MAISMHKNSKQQLKQRPKTGLLLLVVGSILLSGCSSLGLGSNEYGCSGMPEGVRCLSAGEVYELTSHGNISKTINALAARLDPNDDYSLSDLATGRLSHPVLAETQQSAPIRVASRVMRIWIAPWEDQRGDLNVSSYVFTEIEPRRWNIGVPAPRIVSPVLRPLHTQGEPPPTGDDGKRDTRN